MKRLIFWRAAIVAIVLLAFWPTLGNQFGGWDDDMNLVANPDFNPPSMQTIAKYWRRPAFDLYVPVTFTAWTFISAIAFDDGSLHPFAFHAANLLLHIAAALGVFELLRRLSGKNAAAFFGAMIFALHPVQVESVAWVSGLKDVLAGTCAIFALLFYLSEKPSVLRYVVATLFFAIGLLAKPSAIVLPPIALLLDLGMRRRSLQSSCLHLIPWALMTLPVILMARHAQAAEQIVQVPFTSRPLVALDAIAFYLWKLIWPLKLGIDYGRTPQWVITRGWKMMTWLPPLLLAVITIILAQRKVFWPLIAFAIFVIALSPVLGLTPFDFQAYSTVTDHYLYLAMLGAAIAVTMLLSNWPKLIVPTCIVGGVLAVLSFMQARTWHDGITVSRQALQANPQSWASARVLASLLTDRGHPDEALPYAKQAAELNPQFGLAFDEIGRANLALGNFPDAIIAYRRAIEIAPSDIPANAGLADAFAGAGQRDNAIAQYRAALKLAPYDAVIWSNLASVYAESGRFDDAIDCYRKALAINSNLQPAQIGLQQATQARAKH